MMEEGVQRYIDTKKTVLRNMAKIQNELALFQGLEPLGSAERGIIFRRIQAILDDPFTADGLPAGT